MDREYLEDYEQRENNEFEKLVRKKFEEGKFDPEKDRYPPNERFPKLQKPVTQAAWPDFWAQVPFGGSLIISLAPVGESLFEKWYFEVSEISKIISFIKETGRLQVVLGQSPTMYESLDFLEPFFTDLNVPVATTLGASYFWEKEEVQKTAANLGKMGYFDYVREITQPVSSESRFSLMLSRVHLQTYLLLKLGSYSIVEKIEKLILDDPRNAFSLLNICYKFIAKPFFDIRCNSNNFRFDDITSRQALPFAHNLEELSFPCEIGRFLLQKLTYAPQDMRACYDLIDHYDAYDLQRIQASLNEGIIANNPDILSKSAEELSEILENIWNDPEIPKLVKNLRRGIPMSVAAIGTGVSAFTGGLEGFLAGLGFSVGAKFLNVGIEGLSEGLAKWLTRSYQANVYDFKKKYKGKIVS